MDRYIEVTLRKRDVSCVARMLDDLAPKTCEAVWNALPQENDAFHAKYASNEVYCLVPPFAPSEIGLENRRLCQSQAIYSTSSFRPAPLPFHQYAMSPITQVW